MSRVKLLTVSTFLARVTDCRLKSSYTHALQCWADIPLAQSSSLHRYIGFLGSDSKERLAMKYYIQAFNAMMTTNLENSRFSTER